MSTVATEVRKRKPISKEKVMDCISISDVAQAYSPKINSRTKRPQIICPFHEDLNLGSCRIFPDTNTFKCEACGAHGDTLKLAGGYLDFKESDLNDLLERIVIEFGIVRESVEVDYFGRKQKTIPPPVRLTPEEYTELLHSDHYSIPASFQQIEYEEGIWDYISTSSKNTYYRTLALKDPEFHDFVICTVSRKYWRRYTEMLFFSQSVGFETLEQVLSKKIERGKYLLKKGLVNKQEYKRELRLRNELLNETLIEKANSA